MSKLEGLFFDLQGDLDRISKRFVRPKLTLVVRAPDLPDGDVVIGDDDLDMAIAAIERLKSRQPIFEPKKEAPHG